ncbi:cytochrome c4 [Ramlibacter sp. XY19]|nr:c-type cytochrome [Ramlibacter paludis]MCG2592683.1 cytochrome c4 [Ramlibacter paludis]
MHAVFLAGALLAGLAPAVAQDTEAVRAKTQVCAACHGPDGNAVSADFPSLAGQTWRYLYIQLKDYQEGRRSNPLMSPMAANLTREDMIAIANFYAAQPLKPSTFKVDEAKAKLGKAKSEETLCTMCHLGGFLGQNEIPRVAGQGYAYIVAQLKAFKDRTRTNDAGTMTSVARTLGDADIENLGHYLTGLRP